MACIFRVSGEFFDVDKYLASYDRWKPAKIFHKGEPRSRTKKNIIRDSSGFNLIVSENEDFKVQIRDAFDFIELHSVELKKLEDQKVARCLSFSKLYEEHTFPYALFPSAFAREAAKYNLDLEVGMFPK